MLAKLPLFVPTLSQLDKAFLIQSEGESLAAAAGLVCIMMEAQLMCKSLECDLATTQTVSFSNKVRRSALNLMLYKWTESDATSAAAAMVGMAKEAKEAHSLLSGEDLHVEAKYSVCEEIRHCTANVLTMLEKEYACNTAGNADENGIPTSDKSEKPIGVSTVRDLSCEECDSMSKNEHCVKDNSLKGKRNKNLNLKRKLKKEKKKLKREERKLKEEEKLKREKRKLENGNDTKLDKYQGQGP